MTTKDNLERAAALEQLYDHAYRSFHDRRTANWRFLLVAWAVPVISVAYLLKGDVTHLTVVHKRLLVLGALAYIVVLSSWIRGRHRAQRIDRRKATHIEDRQLALLSEAWPEPITDLVKRHLAAKPWSEFAEILLTILLAGAVVVAVALAPSAVRSPPQEPPASLTHE